MKRNEMKPERPEYSGVVIVDEAQGARLCVGPRGVNYLLQFYEEETGLWSDWQRAPRCCIRGLAWAISDRIGQALEDAPDDPVATGLVPYEGGRRPVEPGARKRRRKPVRAAGDDDLLE